MTRLVDLFRSAPIRYASLALAAMLAATSFAPATAQAAQDNGKHLGWYKNGKAGEKRARKAAKADRKAAQSAGVVIIDPDTRVIDRSRTRAQRRTRDNRVYRNDNYRYNGSGRVYDYRNTPVDPYNQYPQYRRNPYNPYGNGGYSSNQPYYNGGSYGNQPYYNGGGYYGNQPYYNDNREGDIDREEVAQRASQNGYYAGFDRGAYDAQQRARANPQGHGAYQFAFDGYDREWGSASTYQQYYRQYFVQGYNDAYNQRSYNTRFPRRRW